MTPLQQAAQELLDRWDSTYWKDQRATSEYVNALREALEAEQAQAVEPDAGERAELIAKYRRLVHAARLRGQSFTPAITKGELLALCDMLEADAKFKPDWVGYRQGVEDGKAEAQQVAVPAVGNTTCNPHPDAPHGFDRNASHSADRYVCDCEGWIPGWSAA